MQKAPLLSFHGKQEIKDIYLKRVETHYKLDEIMKGFYWEEGKGCAVGCTVHSDRHDAYQEELGIYRHLALIEDSIFENLPNEEAKEFPLQFLNAIPVGVNTDLAFKKFVLWNLADEKEGLLTVLKDEKQRVLVERVVGMYKDSYTREIKQEEWQIFAEESSFFASAYDLSGYDLSASDDDLLYSAYARASASASAYARASASASASDSDVFTAKIKRIQRMRDVLLQFLSEL